MQVLADTMADLDASLDSVSESDEEGEGQEAEPDTTPPDRKAYSKRGRALQRHRSTTDVPLFCHPTSPAIMEELVHIFHAQWLCVGTLEGGLGLKVAVEMGLPTIALARNQHHAELLERLLHEQVCTDIMDPQSALFYKPIFDMRAELSAHSISSESDLSDDDPDLDSGSPTEPKKGAKDDKPKKRAKRSKKDKTKSSKKEKKEKTEKGKDKKEKTNKSSSKV